MDWKKLWDSSRSTIISGVIAIAVIAGLFILFNALPAGQPAEKNEEQKQEEQKSEEQKQENKDQDDKVSQQLPTKHTVTAGESLSDISVKYYGTKDKWTLIASENKLSNPDVIHKGNVLSIPKSEVVARTHTVVRGESLWSLAQRYYGSGFQWTKIRDANSGKISLLPNGRPLISPGQVLNIP